MQTVAYGLRHWRTISDIIDRLRELENALYGANRESDVLIEVSRIMHRQFPWQQFRPQTKLAYRYFRIFNTSRISAIAQKAIGFFRRGLYFPLFFWLCTLLVFQHSKISQTPLRLGKPFWLYFLVRRRNSKSIFMLHIHLITLLHIAWGRSGNIRWLPSNGTRKLMLCPLPSLLFWRITSGLYYDLISADKDFANAFGDSFEAYVGDILARTISSPQLCYTKRGRETHGTRSRPKATCDWMLIERESAAAFVECKVKRITVAAKTAMGDLKALEEDIGKLADAVTQLYERIREHRENCSRIRPMFRQENAIRRCNTRGTVSLGSRNGKYCAMPWKRMHAANIAPDWLNSHRIQL